MNGHLWHDIYIEHGDVLAARGTGWLARQILKATATPDYPEGTVSHVGMFVSTNPPVVIEAIGHGIVTFPLDMVLGSCERAYVIHHNRMTDAQKHQLVYDACKYSADLYGFVSLGLQGLNALCRTTWWTDKFAGGMMYCSYLVDEAYWQQGEAFGVHLPRSTTPHEIYVAARANREKFSISEIMLR